MEAARASVSAQHVSHWRPHSFSRRPSNQVVAGSHQINQEASSSGEIRIFTPAFFRPSQWLRRLSFSQVELILRRIPLGVVIAIKREYEGQDLGIIREGNTAEVRISCWNSRFPVCQLILGRRLHPDQRSGARWACRSSRTTVACTVVRRFQSTM